MRAERQRPRAARALGALAALALLPATASGAEPIMPLSEVVPGMTGEVVTAVEGNALETFSFEILEVAGQGQGPAPEIVLFRASGDLLERSGGLSQGMSGSPLYVRGDDGQRRLIGALAFGTGDEGSLIGGATPIEAMLRAGTYVGETRRTNARPRAFRRIAMARDRATALRRQRRSPGVHVLHPLVRWTASGLTRRSRSGLGATFAAAGLPEPIAIPGRSLPPVGSPLTPAAPMSLQLVGGDIAIGGLGTITYVDGDRLWGVGHPVLGLGEVDAMLGDGKVLALVPAPINGLSYKLGDLGRIRGRVTGDYSTGVTAVIGEETGIPVTVNAHYAETGARVNMRLRMAPDERLAPALADTIQREAVSRVRDAEAPGTVYLRLRIESPLWKTPIIARGRYLAPNDVVQEIDPVAGSHLAGLMQNDLREVPISSIRIDQTVVRGIRSAEITGVGIRPRVIRRGGVATLVVRVKPYRARARSYKVRFRVPRRIPLGLREIDIVPNQSADLFPGGEIGGPDEVPGFLGAGGRRTRTVAAHMRTALAATSGGDASRIRRALRDVVPVRLDAVQMSFPGRARVTKTALLPIAITDGEASTSVVIRP